MGKRSKNTPRCSTCRMHVDHCLCADLPHLDVPTRLALVIHRRELPKPTGTGPLAVAALVNSELFVHGHQESPLDLTRLHEEGRRRVLVLFPAEGARDLDVAVQDDDDRPITLVVPDGNWGQATRMPRRIPGLIDAERVTLPPGPRTRWGIRREIRTGGLSTFEAIARAFGILESEAIERELDALFDRMVKATLAIRPTPEPKSLKRPPLPMRRVAPEGGQDLEVVFRDEHLVIVNKPSGSLVHRGWGRDGVTALEQLRDQLGQFVYPAHRLDRATSGALLFALSSEVARDLQTLFASQAIDKRYLAVCRGHDDTLQRAEHPLTDEDSDVARPAITLLRRLDRFERYGLFEARPLTGRTHQIRRHLKHASHPIVGDVRYGKGEHNRLFRERFDFHRLALHCSRLRFSHPRESGEVDVIAPLPADLRNLFGQLGWAREFDASIDA